MTLDSTALKIAKELDQKKHLTLANLLESEIAAQLEIFIQLGITHPRQLLFHFVNQIGSIPKCLCNNDLAWHSDRRRYREYCSKACTARYSVEKKKRKNIEKYGVEWHSQLKGWKAKVQDTSLRKFGVEHYSQTQEFLERSRATNQRNLQVDHPAQSFLVKEKMRDTSIKKYGVANPAQSESVQEKIKTTNFERYGVVNPAQSTTIKEKIQQTVLDRYGVKNPLQNDKILEKSIKTRKTNYYDPDVLVKLQDPNWLADQHQTLTIGEIAKTLGVSSSNLARYFHQHGIKINQHSVTEFERKLSEHFNKLGVEIVVKDRKIIAPKEIDIYFPSIKLGIEINGGYWHSEQFKIGRNYHLDKTLAAKQQGVELWHFWDWEFENNYPLILSKIEHQLGLSSKIFARKLSIGTVDYNEKKAFLEQNHIQSDCVSKINIGLYDWDHNLIMVGTFGSSRFNQASNWELLRLATKQNTSVVGGASKIIQHFVDNYMDDGQTLLSYSHRRFGSGNVYGKIGFELQGTSPPSYFYVKAGKPMGSRNQWQKHLLESKLSEFDPGLSEKENMKANGYYRIWDCGQMIFVLTKKK